MLAPRFRKIVQDMEEYLNPLLTQFDFSCLRWSTVYVIRFPNLSTTKAWQISFSFLSLRKETLLLLKWRFYRCGRYKCPLWEKSFHVCVQNKVRLVYLLILVGRVCSSVCLHAASLHKRVLHVCISYTLSHITLSDSILYPCQTSGSVALLILTCPYLSQAPVCITTSPWDDQNQR